ncbi:MAG: hypothetical protein IBX64_12375 [Actinobacteria bacterium]|nr:hypothetical protein [Actinomycetota bacterium]
MTVSSAFVPETPQQAPKKPTPKEGAPTDVKPTLYTSPVRRGAFARALFEAVTAFPVGGNFGAWLRERVAAPGGQYELRDLRAALDELGYPVGNSTEIMSAVRAEVEKEVATEEGHPERRSTYRCPDQTLRQPS